MSKPKRYTITTALPYTNGPIHIGHLAGVYVPADIYVRYLRLTGNDVAFIGGSDEHGVPITIKAKNEGVSPQDIVDKYHAIIKQSFVDFGITYDNYSRTTAPIHHETASEFFTTLYNKGEFIEESTEQLYDAEANQFLADRFVVGTCPKCGNEESYGDQCENCGTSHNATDLINPKSALTGNVPTLKQTKHWFLPLDKHEAFLKEWILEGHKKDWKPNVYGQVKSWIDDGLRPRAVTRDLDWGIPVPAEGGETEWADMRAAYDALDESTQQRISNLAAYHSLFYSQAKVGHKPEKGASYGLSDQDIPLRPLVKIHPVTGRPALFAGRHAYGIPGLSKDESESLLESLMTFACQPPRVFAHKWRSGDVVMWDNRCVLHRARPYDYAQPRVMRHVRVAGDPSSEAGINA
mgnify:CR=1 FL=1